MLQRRPVGGQIRGALGDGAPAGDILRHDLPVALGEQRFERGVAVRLGEDYRAAALRHDDHDLGPERGRDIVVPRQALVRQRRRDRVGKPVTGPGDALEQALGPLPLVGALVGRDGRIDEGVGRGQRGGLGETGRLLRRAAAAGRDHDGEGEQKRER